ncbi:MAG: CHAT domain-containing protein [Planctomycetes bacterium]|nr:CHAT domain-containing protein [Planctomycetota bacterium]
MTDPSSGSSIDLDALLALPRQQQAALVRGCDDADAALGELGLEAEQLAVTDVARALTATETLVEVADLVGTSLGRALARRARGHALCNAGRLEEGWVQCTDAAALAEEAGRPVEAGRARLRSMQALGELGRFNESIEAGEAARRAFLDADEDALAARAEVNIGIMYQRHDDPARAMEYFDRARPRIGDEPLSKGTVDNNRGVALLVLNDFSGAQDAFTSAVAHCERADASLMTAVVEGNLADLAARRGLLHRAVYHFERARRQFESRHSEGHLARLLTEQAEAMSVLGLPTDALDLYEAALPQLDRAGQALEAARARAGLGRALVRLGRLSEAETALAAAARAFDELGHASARARVDLVRAELAAANGLAAEARRLIHAALSVLHDRPIESATARYLLARLALEEGSLDMASAELAAALETVRRLDLAPLLADLLHTKGRLCRRQGDLQGAVSNLEAAAAQIERVRGTLHAIRFRGAFLSDRLGVYDDLLAVLLERGGDESVRRAFAVAEQAKSRLLLEVLGGQVEPGQVEPGQGEPDVSGSDRPAADPQEQQLVEAYDALRAELSGLYSRLGDDVAAGADASWHDAIVDREHRLEALESRLSTTRGAVTLYAPPADLDAAVAALPERTTLIEFAGSGGEVLAFVVSEGKPVVCRTLGPVVELEDRMARLQFQMNRALRPGAHEGWRAERLLDDVVAELAALDRMLMAPLRRLFPEEDRLLIVPHGPLHMLPFNALWDGTHYLVQRHEIHTAPSAGVYAQLARRPARQTTGRRAVVVGVADEVAPRIESEARRVAALLGDDTTTLIGPDASVARFCAAVPRADLIHLACHARFAPATPLGSGVRLADRWLTVRDIFSLRLDAGLVTLSGCETGRSLVHTGDELVGLLRGFLAAGASSVLVSLWRVDDETAAPIMEEFYEAWMAGSHTTAGALRQAQLHGLLRSPHPAYWAPFQLTGLVLAPEGP